MSYGARSSLSASSVPTATALPCMSVCMSYMLLWVLRLMPPVSKQMPLPTSASFAAPLRRCGSAIAQPDDAGIALLIGARHGEKCASAPPPQRCLVEEVELPAFTAREIAQRSPIAAGVQDIRRQRGEPARHVIAAIDGHRARGVERRAAIEQRERSAVRSASCPSTSLRASAQSRRATRPVSASSAAVLCVTPRGHALRAARGRERAAPAPSRRVHPASVVRMPTLYFLRMR